MQLRAMMFFETVSVVILLMFHLIEGQTSGDIRLVTNDNSTNTAAGRLEVFLNGQWGTVCEDDFGQEDGDVACRQLGYEGAIGYGRVRNFGYNEANTTTPTWLDNLECTGSESRLDLCPHSGVGVENCTHQQDLGLVCYGLPSTSPTNGTLRLNTEGVTNPRTYSGRLEIYWNGQWGTVCDDLFGGREANLACQQLGFETALFFGDVSNVGFNEASSSTPIWLSNLDCMPTLDRTLINCVTRPIGDNNCRHSEDVALVCLGTGSLRLVNDSSLIRTSVSRSSGRLEIYINREWRTVCSNSFRQPEADVACRQLGFQRAFDHSIVGVLGFTRASTSTVSWLDGLDCTPDDTSLLTCNHNGVGIADCRDLSGVRSHVRDTAISCTPSTSSSGNSSVGIIVSAVVLSVLLVAVIILVYFGLKSSKFESAYFKYRRRRRNLYSTTTETTTAPDIPSVQNYTIEAQQPPLPFSNTPSSPNTSTQAANVSGSKDEVTLLTNPPPAYTVSATYAAYPAQGTSLQETDGKTVDFTAHQY